jgi:hypothetical protein
LINTGYGGIWSPAAKKLFEHHSFIISQLWNNFFAWLRSRTFGKLAQSLQLSDAANGKSQGPKS